ncbi:transposable element Tcb2 transposase [Trichonephila clavipes]|nr:transposable element Tcb2 transposase [Trichonephila clavipes]
MQSDCALRIGGRGCLKSLSAEYKTGPLVPRDDIYTNTSRLERRHIVKNSGVQPTASSATIQAQVAPSIETPSLLEPYEGAWLKDIWESGTHPLTPSFGMVQARGNWTALEWNLVVFSDARIQIQSQQ